MTDSQQPTPKPTSNQAAPVLDSDDLRIKSLLEAVPIPENLKERTKSRLRMVTLVDPCLDSHEKTLLH